MIGYKESVYIVVKYTFKINNAVIYYHIGSTCDPAGTLILVLLDPNTRSFYDKQFILKFFWDLHIWKKGEVKKKNNKIKKYIYIYVLFKF